MKLRTISLGTALATVSLLGTLVPAQFASASTKGKKNTAIGLGAGAVYELLNKKTTNGLLLGAGAAYAYKQYKESQANDKRRQRVSAYRSSSSRRYHSRYGSRYGGSSTNYNASRATFTGTVDRETDYVHRRVFVYANGADRRIEIPKNIPIYQAGQRISAHDLRKGDVLHISGVRTGSNDWRATRVDVVQSAGVDTGSNPYVTDSNYRYGGAADTRAYPEDTINRSPAHYSGLGIVRSVDPNNGSFVVRAGNHTRTIFARDTQFDGANGVSDIQPGDHVRISGDMNGSDVDATQVTLVR